ncbi:transcriptional regulator, TetR family [Hyphomonas neptunium ATCC 15444]|uniref:Transcriptional regulator, TetR family n=2 Tax=Hyphomonas TaxID=85 RepID=Q0BYZ7_HYPNA|nr:MULTISPECIES: TetR/AcrR family transcriptional regulator [Hyphomonas]ABI78616.1 transcriptional regulator, TetR family [Hyphomonas neptunium ATCC 15444]KCZ87291.1 TetR family transcriptional regulator [Hyphomonas hirschiana VP5]
MAAKSTSTKANGKSATPSKGGAKNGEKATVTKPEEPIRRPRVRDARPKIERAALELFVTVGVDAATTREIAESAQVSEGALYRHYKGKDELALALFMETHNRLSAMLAEALGGQGGLDEKVHAAVAAYCSLADEDFLLFSFHLVSLNKYLPYDKRRADDPVSITEGIIMDLMDAAAIPKGDPALKAAMALGVVMQAGQNKIYNRLPGPLSRHAPALARAVLAVLKSN